MSTRHAQNQNPTPIEPATPLSTRCLRHRVWMAACGDCRDAHREQLSGTSRSAA